ncbi:MAG: transporter substrate-binding domain-containing protein, partial [Vicinamibacterales bacterium]
APLIEIPRAADQPAYPPSRMQGVGNPARGDLDEIVARGFLRVLVAPSPTQFTISNGVMRGRAHDVGQAFQAFLHKQDGAGRVQLLLIATPEDALITDLLAGKGDIAANLLLTFARDDQVAFAAPLLKGIGELVVTGPDQPPLVSLEDAGGRTIHVRRSSDHHASLLRLNEQLKAINRPPARIVVAPPNASDEALLEMVNSGRIPATITDDYLFDLLRSSLTKMSANRDVAVSQDGVVAWATRKDAPQLLAVMNEFFSTHKLTF